MSEKWTPEQAKSILSRSMARLDELAVRYPDFRGVAVDEIVRHIDVGMMALYRLRADASFSYNVRARVPIREMIGYLEQARRTVFDNNAEVYLIALKRARAYMKLL